jgi:hypothetical protein
MGEVHIGFWWGKLRKIDHFEYPGLDGRIILMYLMSELKACVVSRGDLRKNAKPALLL